MPVQEQFASDNYAGICPEAMEYLTRANNGSATAYGDDEWTQRAADKFREVFETDCDVYFVFNGTAANSLSLAAMCQPYHSIICHELAHIETDECGAPEFFSNGAKLLTGTGEFGKLTPHAIEAIVTRRQDIHYPKPKVISLTQSTELGTCYSLGELAAIRQMADKYELKVQMDGARFANAVAATGLSPAQLSWQQGVDVLSFGGTKNGIAYGEAVLFFDRALAQDFEYRCKQAGQLASKMRFIAAPLLGLLETGAWLRNATHANRQAACLEQQLLTIPGLSLLVPRQANAVFVSLPEPVINELKGKGWRFYTFIGDGGVRLMCSWTTTREGIDKLIADIRIALANSSA